CAGGAARLGTHLRERRRRPSRQARARGDHRHLRRGRERGRGARLAPDRRTRRREESDRRRRARGRAARTTTPPASGVMPSRIEALLGFIRANPQDPFPRYALALEYKNGGRLDEARTTFDALMAANPDYTAAYLHAGNTLLALGLRD